MAKIRIPKKVGGVKIPKKVRRRVKETVRMAESPAMRDLAASALASVRESGALRASRRRDREEEEGATIRIDGEQLVETIRIAAIDGLRRFLEGLEEGLQEMSERLDEAAGEPRRPRPPKPPKPPRPPRNPEVSARWRDAGE